MTTPNPFGAAFDGPDPVRWPGTGLRRRYSPDPGPLATAAEIAAGVLTALSAGVIALGVFLPPPADGELPLAVNSEACLWAGWVGMAVAVTAAVTLAAVNRSRTGWQLSAAGVLLAAAGAVATLLSQ